VLVHGRAFRCTFSGVECRSLMNVRCSFKRLDSFKFNYSPRVAVVILHHLAFVVRDVSNRHANRLAFTFWNTNWIILRFVNMVIRTFILTTSYLHKRVSATRIKGFFKFANLQCRRVAGKVESLKHAF
jgi:hypothetical protein